MFHLEKSLCSPDNVRAALRRDIADVGSVVKLGIFNMNTNTQATVAQVQELDEVLLDIVSGGATPVVGGGVVFPSAAQAVIGN